MGLDGRPERTEFPGRRRQKLIGRMIHYKLQIASHKSTIFTALQQGIVK